MPPVITIPAVGGIVQVAQGFVPVINPNVFIGAVVGRPFIKKQPIQIVGLTPLYPCTIDDCRYIDEDDIVNKVFGYIPDGVNASYKNDFTPILIDMSAYSANPSQTSVSFLLQKLTSGVWATSTTLTNNTYGVFYGLNTFLTPNNHHTYTGYALNWGLVLNTFGPGTYRIKVTTSFSGGGGVSFSGCLVTDCFHLRTFDCDLAHGTVKFERWITGKYGDPYLDYYIHDICGINWYDSFRYNGKFGDRKTDEYREVSLKWGSPKHGKIELVKDEAVPSFEWSSNYMRQPYHDRFSVFGMMGGETRVSDYNINNSDYELKRVVMVKAGSYAPVNHDTLWRRISRVDVKFKRGVQSIIHSTCCDRTVIT